MYYTIKVYLAVKDKIEILSKIEDGIFDFHNLAFDLPKTQSLIDRYEFF